MKKSRKNSIVLLFIGFLLGSSFTAILWYNHSQKVTADIYACYYGQKYPWPDHMSESLFRIQYINDQLYSYDYKCVTHKNNFSCDIGAEKTYVETIETTKQQINKYLIPISYFYTEPARLLNDSFFRLYPSYFYARNTLPYAGPPN